MLRSDLTQFAGERGSVLMLMPAAVLIVLTLGAIAVDLTLVHLAEREIHAAASAAANDAVTYGIDPEQLYADGPRVLDPERVRQVINLSLAAQEISGHSVDYSFNTDVASGTVTVTVRATVDYLFARSLPEGPDDHTVITRASATTT